MFLCQVLFFLGGILQMFNVLVIPAKAGIFIHIVKDSGLRRNDMLNIIGIFSLRVILRFLNIGRPAY